MIRRLQKYVRFALRFKAGSMPRLGIVGGVYGANNLGDESLRIAYDRIFPSVSVVELPRKTFTAKVASFVIPSIDTILAGGTLINQKRIWLDLALAYKAKSKSFSVFGSGVADTAFWGDQLEDWRPVLEDSLFLGVRGPLSAKMLEAAGYTDVCVAGDPVLVYARDVPVPPEPQEKRLGLNLGWDSVGQWGDREKVVTEFKQFVKYAHGAGWNLRWFNVCPQDAERGPGTEFGLRQSDEVLNIFSDPDEYISKVQECSVFVGSRLHSVVLANCAYVPSIMLEYRPKCRDYMLSIDQGEHVVKTDTVRASDLWAQVESIYSNRDSISNDIRTSIAQLRSIQSSLANRLQKRWG